MDNKFYTVEEAANLLKTNKRQIVRLINAGKIKAQNISAGTGVRKRWRIYADSLNEWTHANTGDSN